MDRSSLAKKAVITNLIKITAPLWLPVVVAAIGGYVISLFHPLSQTGKIRVFYLFVFSPVVFSFFWGNIAIIKIQTGAVGKVVACICYSVIAFFVLFFVGWSSMMHLHI